MEKKFTLKRILAIIAIILIVGMYILSLVATLSNWECKKEIFMATLAGTIFIPIIIYIIQVFAKMGKKDTENEQAIKKENISEKAKLK